MINEKIRVNEHNDHVYVIRDVREQNGEFAGCEYAHFTDEGLQWTPCPEGVMFDDIKPYSTAKEWRTPLSQGRIEQIIQSMQARVDGAR